MAIHDEFVEISPSSNDVVSKEHDIYALMCNRDISSSDAWTYPSEKILEKLREVQSRCELHPSDASTVDVVRQELHACQHAYDENSAHTPPAIAALVASADVIPDASLVRWFVESAYPLLLKAEVGTRPRGVLEQEELLGYTMRYNYRHKDIERIKYLLHPPCVKDHHLSLFRACLQKNRMTIVRLMLEHGQFTRWDLALQESYHPDLRHSILRSDYLYMDKPKVRCDENVQGMLMAWILTICQSQLEQGCVVASTATSMELQRTCAVWNADENVTIILEHARRCVQSGLCQAEVVQPYIDAMHSHTAKNGACECDSADTLQRCVLLPSFCMDLAGCKQQKYALDMDVQRYDVSTSKCYAFVKAMVVAIVARDVDCFRALCTVLSWLYAMPPASQNMYRTRTYSRERYVMRFKEKRITDSFRERLVTLPLLAAVTTGDFAAVQCVLHNTPGLDFSWSSNTATAALCFAAYAGQTSMVRAFSNFQGGYATVGNVAVAYAHAANVEATGTMPASSLHIADLTTDMSRNERDEIAHVWWHILTAAARRGAMNVLTQSSAIIQVLYEYRERLPMDLLTGFIQAAVESGCIQTCMWAIQHTVQVCSHEMYFKCMLPFAKTKEVLHYFLTKEMKEDPAQLLQDIMHAFVDRTLSVSLCSVSVVDAVHFRNGFGLAVQIALNMCEQQHSHNHQLGSGETTTTATLVLNALKQLHYIEHAECKGTDSECGLASMFTTLLSVVKEDQDFKYSELRKFVCNVELPARFAGRAGKTSVAGAGSNYIG